MKDVERDCFAIIGINLLLPIVNLIKTYKRSDVEGGWLR